MAAKGMTLRTIAETLQADNVLIPSAYWEQKGMTSRNHNYHNPYLWTNASVAYILNRQEYLGHTVLGKTVSENFKTKKRKKARTYVKNIPVCRSLHADALVKDIRFCVIETGCIHRFLGVVG